MKNCFIYLVITLLLSISHLSFGQPNVKPNPRTLEAMNKVYFMEGKWKGTGWIQFGPKKNTFIQTEDIRLKVNGTVIQIDGRGVASEDTNMVIHQAYATISYDLSNSKYLMRAFRADGNYIDADFSVQEDGSIIWKFKSPQAGEIKYTIRLVDNKWVEKGEISRDGQSWLQFFEMSLSKVK